MLIMLTSYYWSSWIKKQLASSIFRLQESSWLVCSRNLKLPPSIKLIL